MTWSHFISMGGYGSYVWSAYGFAAVVLIANVLLPVLRRKAVLRRLRQFAQSEVEEMERI